VTDRETAEHNPRAWFAYDPLDGVSFFATEAEARAQAEAWLDEERDRSVDGWSEEVEGICYGLVTGYVVQTKNEPAPEGSEFDYIADYALRDAARASAPPSPGLVEAARDFVDVADRAEAARTMRTGMQAPYHGDFANMAPSTARALRKWADRFRAALPKEPTP